MGSFDRAECERLIIDAEKRQQFEADLADRGRPHLSADYVDGWNEALNQRAQPLIEQLQSALAEIDRLALSVKLTNETPFASEIEGWKSERAAMIAEVGTLRSEVAELRRESQPTDLRHIVAALLQRPATSTSDELTDDESVTLARLLVEHVHSPIVQLSKALLRYTDHLRKVTDALEAFVP